MLIYEKEMMRRMVKFLDQEKERILHELTTVDHETLTKLREMMCDYYTAKSALDDKVAVANVELDGNIEEKRMQLASKITEMEEIFGDILDSMVEEEKVQFLEFLGEYKSLSEAAAKIATDTADEVIAQRVAEIGTIVQTTGNSPTAVMSQKGTTDLIGKVIFHATDFTWQQGNLATTMQPYADTTRIVSNPIDVGSLVDRDVQFSYNRALYDIAYKTFDENGAFIADTSWLELGGTYDTYSKVTLADNVRYIMVIIRDKNTNGTIPTDAPTEFMFVRSMFANGSGTSEKLVMSQKDVSDMVTTLTDVTERFEDGWEKKGHYKGSSASVDTFYGDDPTYSARTKVYSTTKDLLVRCDPNYLFGIHTWQTADGKTMLNDSGWQNEYVIPAGTNFTLSFKREDYKPVYPYDRTVIHFYENASVVSIAQKCEETSSIHQCAFGDTVKSIAHRGYSLYAPENTLSAYRLAKKNGCAIVEADVAKTKDGHLVLLHDATIDRTSNGTGSVGNLTLEELRTFDFGSWFSEECAGEKIPTFEEFLALCKELNLHAYLDMLTSPTDTYAVVKKYGMQKHVTYICSSVDSLAIIKNIDDTARIGLTVVNSVSDISSVINSIKALKTEKNEVFIDIAISLVTDEIVTQCINNDIPIEVFWVDNASQIKQMNPYITGVTHNGLDVIGALYGKGMTN